MGKIIDITEKLKERAGDITDRIRSLDKDQVGTVRKTVGAVIPLFAEENKEYHLENIFSAYPDVQYLVDLHPQLYDALENQLNDSLHEFRYDLLGSKAADSVDRLAAGVELGALVVSGPVGSAAVEPFTESAELLVKVPFVAYNTWHAQDYGAPAYFAGAEALSLVPVLGAAVDLKNLYWQRVQGQVQKDTAEKFLEKYGHLKSGASANNTKHFKQKKVA